MKNAELTPLQRAAVVIKELRTELDLLRRAQSEPIAILGMACRLPGGIATPQAYWDVLANGVDTVTEVPPERWNVNEYYDSDLGPGTMNTKWGGFLDQVDQFDPEFFDLGEREAACMDPQQRLLLEVAWEAFEDAGIAPGGLAGSKTGVFIGICSPDYGGMHAIPPPRGNTGVSLSIAANRLSYWFDLTGPSFVVDTACSASLIALHLAAKSLRDRECNVAMAGGVNVTLSPTTTVAFAQAGMMAPDGRCKTFDAAADGYVRGEGCGLVVLKRLSDALKHGDRILALMLGSATNQDGRTNGLTAPKGSAQVDVVSAALANANVKASQISYVETHGTGTPLGDAVEVAALATALGRERDRSQCCVLGAAKTNIGHLESAAGIAGLIKVVLAMQHDAIPPVVHFRTLNPKIDMGNVSFSIPRTLTRWPVESGRRIAGLSSFSFGGSNAHLIIGEAPPSAQAVDSAGPPYILPLSAKSNASLTQLASRFAEWLEQQHPAPRLCDVSHTLGVGRTHFPLRLALIAGTPQDFASMLRKVAASEACVRSAHARPKKVAFVFDSAACMTKAYAHSLKTEPRLREVMKDYVHAAEEITGTSFEAILAGADDRSAGILAFCAQFAQARLLMSLAIAPAAVAGSGEGAWVAAALVGIASVKDAMLRSLGSGTQTSERLALPNGVASAGIAYATERGFVSAPTSLSFDAVEEAAGGKNDGRLLDVLRENGVDEVIRFGSVPVVEGAAAQPDANAREQIAGVVAELYLRGHPIDWAAWNRIHNPRKISLPTYAFNRHRCWLEPDEIRPPIQGYRA